MVLNYNNSTTGKHICTAPNSTEQGLRHGLKVGDNFATEPREQIFLTPTFCLPKGDMKQNQTLLAELTALPRPPILREGQGKGSGGKVMGWKGKKRVGKDKQTVIQ